MRTVPSLLADSTVPLMRTPRGALVSKFCGVLSRRTGPAVSALLLGAGAAEGVGSEGVNPDVLMKMSVKCFSANRQCEIFLTNGEAGC